MVTTVSSDTSAAIDLIESLSSPPTSSRPYVRWWWPHGVVDGDEIRNELIQIADAGFGGVEIEDVHHSIATGTEFGTDTHGWGSQPWLDAVSTAVKEANSRNMAHDIAFGPAWPMGIPSIVPDDEAAAKEIVLGKAFVTSSTYNGSVPAPFVEPKDNVKNQTLVAVQAWRVNSKSNSSANPVYLDYGSMIDLTDEVVQDTVSFTPPDNETWLIFSAVVRGTGQQPEDYPHTYPLTYVVDHFSTAGAHAVIDYWEEHLLSSELLALLTETSTALFEDSLEMVTATYWTPSFENEFLARRGYDIRTILPTITQYKDNQNLFQFADLVAQRGALHDYHETLSDFYADHHIKPLKAWLNSRGLAYRAQPYGIPKLDGMRIAAGLDVSEGESLGFEAVDDYRALAGAGSMARLAALSNELGAYRRSAYATTWAQVLATANADFAAGVTRNVLHGFSYIDGPGATWPGWAAFTPYQDRIGYSESWGPRHPAWMHAPDFAAYVARVQEFVARGVAKYDCALFRQNGAADDDYVGPYSTTEGARGGWTATYVDAALLELPAAYVEDGRLAPGAGNYSLVVVEGDPDADGAALLTVSSAQKLLEFAEAGLPMLVIGDWSESRVLGLSSGNSSSIASSVEHMLALDKVVNVGSARDIPSGLEELGILPTVRHESSTLTHIRREDGDLDLLFFVADSSSEGVDQTVSLPVRHGNVVPIQLDPWTGNATGLPLYRLSNGRLEFPISLQPQQSALIVVTPTTKDIRHTVSSTAENITRDTTTDQFIIRSTNGGEYKVTFNDGSEHIAILDNPLPTIELNAWFLKLDDWQPAEGNGTTGDVSATKFVRHELNLTSLEPWTSIDGLQNVSGNATYSTTLTLGTKERPYASTTGAYLRFNEFLGSFRVNVNAEELPPLDQLDVQFDISKWLNNGTNTIQVEVASSLLNRMRALQPQYYQEHGSQAFGLQGVTVQCFKQALIDDE